MSDDAPKSSDDLVEAEVNAIRDPDLVASRREQLLDAGLKLFLEKGFASTTIRDICARSGVNQASIYDYVANKQDILRRLLNRVWFRPNALGMAEQLSAPDAPELRDMLREFFSRGWTENREGTLLAYRAVPHLDAADRKTLREREERLMAALSAYLRARGGLAADDARRGHGEFHIVRQCLRPHARLADERHRRRFGAGSHDRRHGRHDRPAGRPDHARP